MERGRFEQYVREALEHLFDPTYLHTHPLAAHLAFRKTQGMAGDALQRTLREAIEQLKPSTDVPRHSPAWRTYLAVRLRYLDMLTMPEIANQLGIGTRQCRRDHHKALEAIATQLWEKCHQGRTSYVEGSEVGTPGPWAKPEEPLASSVEVEVGKLGQPSPDWTNVAQVVDGALITISGLAERKEIHLAAAVPPDLPFVAMDRTALRQALLGVLLASMEWGDGCQITLTALADEGFVVLRCLAQRPRANPPIPLAANSWHDRLAISSRLIQMQGGIMQVHEMPTRARIDLSLPIGQRLKILVIDDNPDTLLLFRRYLSGGAYEIIEANNGSDALHLARDIHPDAVVLDVMMPTMDGWETLQAIKNHPATKEVPIIVCSVLKERELALILGAVDCLSKPVSQEELISSLGRHCGRLRHDAQPGLETMDQIT